MAKGKDSKRPDVGVLPTSEKSAGGEKVGVKDQGYLDKKGTPSGMEAKFNHLPPGMNIEDQAVADIRTLPFKQVTELGYPGDGWT